MVGDYTEFSIQKTLIQVFKDHRFHVLNSYIFGHESDYFSIAPSGYTYEIEVKLSYSDFKADQRKERKHRMIKEVCSHKKEHCITGRHTFGEGARNSEINIGRTSMSLPNRFYYCAVNEDIIPVEEVPDYAGLIYVGAGFKKIKEAKLLHKHKFDNYRIIAEKLYWKYFNLIMK